MEKSLFIEYFVQVILKDTVSALHKSPFIGVGLDESTDRSSEKHVVFVVRYESHDKMRTTYLQIKEIKDGKAETIYQVLREVFQHHKIPLKKVS